MIFAVKVEHYIPEETEIEKCGLFVTAKDMHDVINKINAYFGKDNIESISMEYFSPDNFLLFSDEELYDLVKNKLAKEVIW